MSEEMWDKTVTNNNSWLALACYAGWSKWGILFGPEKELQRVNIMQDFTLTSCKWSFCLGKHLLTESRKTYYYQSCFPFLFANQRSGTVIAHICDVHFFKKRRCNFPHFVILKIALRSRLSREIQLTQRVPMTWTQVFSLFQYYWVLVEKNVALGWLGAPGRTFGLLKAYSKLRTIIQ